MKFHACSSSGISAKLGILIRYDNWDLFLKWFLTYENCSDSEEEEDGYEKYLAIEEGLPAERVNLVTTNKSDRGAWVEQEFIAPELKPYHEEAERLRYDIEDKIKTLNSIVISNKPAESEPIETEKQDSTTQEPTLIDTETYSSSIMNSKKQVKKKPKKPPARKQKCNGGSGSSSANDISKATKAKKPENSNPKSILPNDSSAPDKKTKRNVQDEELEGFLNKLQENKMRRWAMIKQKFFEKYSKEGENSKEWGGTGHRNYESLGQEANLVYTSEDLLDYHVEANTLRDKIENKILTLKPYQAKLKGKKKAQGNQDCSEETIEKIVKATLQFQKKCSLNGDPIVSSPSKSPKANHRNPNETTSSPSSPSPKKAVVKPNSCNLQKSQNDKSDSTANLASGASVQDKNSTKGKSRSKPLALKNRTVLKFQKRQSIKSSNDSGDMAELDSESVIDESSTNDDMDSFSPASNKIESVTIDELAFQHLSLKNKTVQRIKELPPVKNTRPSTSSFFDNHDAEKLSSESAEIAVSGPLPDFTSTSVENSSMGRSSAVKKRKYKRSKDQIAADDRLDSTAVRSASSFCDEQDIEKLSHESIEMATLDPLSDSTSTSIENNSKVRSSGVKKRKNRRSQDQIGYESVEMTAAGHLLDSDAFRSDFKETSSSAALEQQKGKDLRRKGPPLKTTLPNPSPNSLLKTPERNYYNYKNERNIDSLTSPNPSNSPGGTMSCRKRFQKRQSIKRCKTIINSEEMAKLVSESVIDENSTNDDLNSVSSASDKIETESVDLLPFKQLSLKSPTVLSKEGSQSDLDLFAVSGTSECETESGPDKRTGVGFYNPSPTKHQTLRASPRKKELHPQTHSRPSPSSFHDEHGKDQLSSESIEMTSSPSDFTSTSVENSSKLSSSATKKRKYKPREDQIARESVEMTASDHLLNSTHIGSDVEESPSALKKRKGKDLSGKSLPLKQTIRLPNPSPNSSLKTPDRTPSFSKRSHHMVRNSPILHTVPVDVLVTPPLNRI